jgi:CopG family nickel-responsive transcriptional regulator
MVVERVGVSFEPELLAKFDILIQKKGYTNRSEAIRDLVRELIVRSDVKEPGGRSIGTITILYNHDMGDVTNRLLHLQHHRHGEILATIHVHIDEYNCLEVLVVRGMTKHIIELADNIKAIKGVKHGELVLTKADL